MEARRRALQVHKSGDEVPRFHAQPERGHRCRSRDRCGARASDGALADPRRRGDRLAAAIEQEHRHGQLTAHSSTSACGQSVRIVTWKGCGLLRRAQGDRLAVEDQRARRHCARRRNDLGNRHVTSFQVARENAHLVARLMHLHAGRRASIRGSRAERSQRRFDSCAGCASIGSTGCISRIEKRSSAVAPPVSAASATCRYRRELAARRTSAAGSSPPPRPPPA